MRQKTFFIIFEGCSTVRNYIISERSRPLKWKSYRDNDYSIIWRFYWVITWKLFLSRDYPWWRGNKIRWKEVYCGEFFKLGREWAIFWLMEGLPPFLSGEIPMKPVKYVPLYWFMTIFSMESSNLANGKC